MCACVCVRASVSEFRHCKVLKLFGLVSNLTLQGYYCLYSHHGNRGGGAERPAHVPAGRDAKML